MNKKYIFLNNVYILLNSSVITNEDNEKEETDHITFKTAKEHFRGLSNYIYQSEKCDEECIRLMKKICMKMEYCKEDEQQQNLDYWIIWT